MALQVQGQRVMKGARFNPVGEEWGGELDHRCRFRPGAIARRDYGRLCTARLPRGATLESGMKNWDDAPGIAGDLFDQIKQPRAASHLNLKFAT
jgi:hypothetical protein